MSAHSLQRLARACHVRGIPAVPELLRHTIRYLHHAELPYTVEIGPGTVFDCDGLGVAVDDEAVIGRGCRLGDHVSLARGGEVPGAPILEDFVTVEAGASIVGGVRIGRGAVIGANVLVRWDVPPGMRIERDVLQPISGPVPEVPPVNQVQAGTPPLFPGEANTAAEPPSPNEAEAEPGTDPATVATR